MRLIFASLCFGCIWEFRAVDFTVTGGANLCATMCATTCATMCAIHNVCNVCYNVFTANTWYCFLGVQNPITTCIPTLPSAQISLAGLKYSGSCKSEVVNSSNI